MWILDLATEALKDIIPSNKPRIINIARIQLVVGSHFGLKLEDFEAKKD